MAFMFMLSRNRRNRVFADDRPRTTARSCADASHNGVKLWVCSPRSDQRRRSIVGPPTALTSFLASLDGKLTEPLCVFIRYNDANVVDVDGSWNVSLVVGGDTARVPDDCVALARVDDISCVGSPKLLPRSLWTTQGA